MVAEQVVDHLLVDLLPLVLPHLWGQMVEELVVRLLLALQTIHSDHCC